jgi:mannosylglycerate hydrolase
VTPNPSDDSSAEISRWPTIAYVVSHTHWDREWYLPFHRFRVSLVRVVRQVLDALEHDPAFNHFLLDGQSVLLEDYLEVHPGDRTRIAKLVERGALAVGPWYVLPDEFLVSAEATMRNLLLGDQVTRLVGPPQKVGYLPDSFGHIAQMPQILRLAGIDSFVFTRGTGNELDRLGWEFMWEAPDGSAVTAVNQCDGYCAAGGLGFSPMGHALTERSVDPALAVAQVGRIFAEMRPLAGGEICLVSNGCDHHPPQQELGTVLEALRRAYPETEFRHASLTAYLEAVTAAGIAVNRYGGEFLGGKRQFSLPGVWSTRIYLKQANDTAQNLLSGCVEPLAAYIEALRPGSYPIGLLDSAWKMLLQNHPHDSICGCSVDEVHRQMMSRFEGVSQTSDQLIRDHLRLLTPGLARQARGDSERRLTLFNPLPRARSEVIERLIVLPGDAPDPAGLSIVDHEGRTVPFTILGWHHVERVWGLDWHTDWSGEQQRERFERHLDAMGPPRNAPSDSADRESVVHVQLLADLPALGHVTYQIRDEATDDPVPPTTGTVRASVEQMENDLVRVRLMPDATFELHDKRTGRTWTGLNRLVDGADVGDEYDYAPSEFAEDVTTEGLKGTVRLVESSEWLAQCEVSAEWSLPAAIDPDRRRRSRRCVPADLRVRLTLRHGSPVVQVDCLLDNQAEDHRLRAAFPTGVVTDTLVSDGHFYQNRRPLRPDSHPDWVQPASGTWPQQDYSLVQDGVHGLALLNRGLPEIEATPDEAGRVTLWLTLLRSVGWLSRDDFSTRKFRNAGPMVPTPEAQCPGLRHFRYAVVPFEGDELSADIHGMSRAWRVPVLSAQGVADLAVTGISLVETTTTSTCITAIKRHQRRGSLVVRLYNLTAAPVSETLRLGLGLVAAWRIDALEERIEPIRRTSDRLVAVDLRPSEIVNLELELELEPAATSSDSAS